jgi:phosphate transport system protein
MWKNLISIFRQEDLYTQALQESYTMLDMDLAMYEASVESLRYSNTGEIKVDIFALDKQINAFERDVRRKVLTHLAVSGPSNLTSGLVLVSIVIDIERIGDYAKNIYDLARKHPRRLHGNTLEEDIREVETGVTRLFKDTVAAFRESDIEASRVIMTTYKGEIAAACDGIVNRIVSGEVSDLEPGAAAAIALYTRYLKRIAGHSRNIITSVVNPFHRIGYKEKKGR